jgi:hypothetical protein
MSFSIFAQQIQDCTGALISPINGAVNIDGRDGYFQLVVQQDQLFDIDAVGFNVTITRALGPPTQIVQNGVGVNGFPGFGGNAGVGSNFAGITVFIGNLLTPPRTPYSPSPFPPAPDLPTLWQSYEVVTLHFECVSTPAGESYSQDFVFTCGDHFAPGFTAVNPASAAINVPLNQVVTMSLRDDPAGAGIDGTTLVLQADPGSGVFETVYDAGGGGFQAPYNGGSIIAPAGNGFDFSVVRTGGWLSYTGANAVSFQFSTCQDLATPVNTDVPQYGFFQLATPGLSFTPNPADGGHVSLFAFGYLDILETGLNIGDPVLHTLTYQINGAGPVHTIYNGAIDPAWSLFFSSPAFQTTRAAFFPNAGVPGNPHNGDSLVFTAFADVPGLDPGSSFTWHWIFDAAVTVAGKKYAIETPDPFTFIVRTSLDGNPADCDFTLGIWGLGLLE